MTRSPTFYFSLSHILPSLSGPPKWRRKRSQLFRIRLWRCSKVFLSCFSFSTIEVSFWVKIVEVREKKVSKLTTSLGILISTLSTAKLGREMVGGSIFPHFSVKKARFFLFRRRHMGKRTGRGREAIEQKNIRQGKEDSHGAARYMEHLETLYFLGKCWLKQETNLGTALAAFCNYVCHKVSIILALETYFFFGERWTGEKDGRTGKNGG